MVVSHCIVAAREIVHHAIRMRVAQKKSSTSVAQYIIWACGADMPGVPGSGAAARAAIAAGQAPPPFDPTGGAVKLQRPAGAPESHVFEMQQQAFNLLSLRPRYVGEVVRLVRKGGCFADVWYKDEVRQRGSNSTASIYCSCSAELLLLTSMTSFLVALV